MCKAPKIEMPATAAIPRMAATPSNSAMIEGDFERMMRRQNSGAAADVLTSQMGIPSTRTQGGI